MQPLIRSVDPVTFEILSHRLHQITKEMAIALERTGGTVNTTQQRDYMTSLYRPDGEILSAGETMGHHVVCAGFAVKRILERFEADEIYPDDIFLLNDPYLAAIHQSDTSLFFADSLRWMASRKISAERSLSAMSPGMSPAISRTLAIGGWALRTTTRPFCLAMAFMAATMTRRPILLM